MNRPRPLCAICADREATTITDWECESGATRTIVACWPCLSPVPDPPEEYEPVDIGERCSTERISARAFQPRNHATRDAVLDAVRCLGEATSADICEAVGAVDEVARATVGQQISRLVKRGALRAVDLYPGRPKAGRIYSATGAPPLSPALRDVLARIVTAPAEFTCDDIGLDPLASASTFCHLADAGLIVRVRRSAQTSRDGQRVTVRAVWRRTGKAATYAA